MKIIKWILVLAVSLPALVGFHSRDGLATAQQTPQTFRQYWYQGKAELTRYALQQARYGEIHQGDAVLIFVTEPFLKDQQVKLEHGESKNAISVLKLNFTRKFFTGVYPYSLMTSVFTPVDLNGQRTLKVTSTTQEWCGQTYTQLNLRNNRYHGVLRSYFQDEGDLELDVDATWLEDDLWTRIRIAPDALPTGEIRLVPGLQTVRLRHLSLKPETAIAALQQKDSTSVYTVEYKTFQRRLKIEFERKFSYAILSWEETGPGGFGPNAPTLTTKGVRTHTLFTDYWNKHTVGDAPLRRQLGLTMP